MERLTALLVIPLTVTETGPLVAPFGTGTTMLDALQIDGDAATPLMLTTLSFCTGPKLDPKIETCAPTAELVGVMLVIIGGLTMKLTEFDVAPACNI